ncbi:hypothetical protein EFL95_02445 [Nocardioides marmorisolisilvae]|uniref:Uncharacterized protein n=2 Tax=Nocardioides marmorisolisilvae TaxID=1542737 RepID=A0A3N0E077_9ACTN|nr:hypothetical protein EFL95_02445 [Nocardioides marmorisolisilvae]
MQLGSGAPFDSSGIRIFFQNTNKCRAHASCPTGSSPYTTKFFGTASKAAFYSSYLRASDDRIHMTAAGTDLGTVGYDVTGQWKPQWSAQYGAETYHFEDDVPGTKTSQTHFDYLQQYAQNGDINFISSLSYTSPATSRYHRASYSPSVGGKGFLVWTDPL